MNLQESELLSSLSVSSSESVSPEETVIVLCMMRYQMYKKFKVAIYKYNFGKLFWPMIPDLASPTLVSATIAFYSLYQSLRLTMATPHFLLLFWLSRKSCATFGHMLAMQTSSKNLPTSADLSHSSMPVSSIWKRGGSFIFNVLELTAIRPIKLDKQVSLHPQSLPPTTPASTSSANQTEGWDNVIIHCLFIL